MGKEICLFSQLERHPPHSPQKKKRVLRLLRNKSSTRFFFSRLIFLCWDGLQIFRALFSHVQRCKRTSTRVNVVIALKTPRHLSIHPLLPCHPDSAWTPSRPATRSCSLRRC